MRPRATYSIATLLIAVMVAAAVLAYVLHVRRLRDAERELHVIRQEMGHLTVEDRTKFHAISVDADEPNTWQWRVFLPKGHRYSWKIASKDIPRNGIPNPTTNSFSNEPYWETDNEALITATLRKTEEGDWRLTVRSKMGTGENRLGGASLIISEKDLAWMSEVPCTDGQVLGDHGQVVGDPQGPFIFLQRRPCERQPDGDYMPSEGPMPGFMIWLQKW